MLRHTNQKPHSCHICGKNFYRHNVLKDHIKDAHKITQVKTKKKHLVDLQGKVGYKICIDLREQAFPSVSPKSSKNIFETNKICTKTDVSIIRHVQNQAPEPVTTVPQILNPVILLPKMPTFKSFSEIVNQHIAQKHTSYHV